ncbi:hypothetical protein EYF80_039454 [Liparis tanakae]|uniref:Uncharacterized protein n=1 Tax=Liparis tanakae TaxID=230148 RepID=A0A4Z2G9U3_9TELE|nr:hypothetical protein EYF80_039454 [Liparis tanakae]
MRSEIVPLHYADIVASSVTHISLCPSQPVFLSSSSSFQTWRPLSDGGSGPSGVTAAHHRPRLRCVTRPEGDGTTESRFSPHDDESSAQLWTQQLASLSSADSE